MEALRLLHLGRMAEAGKFDQPPVRDHGLGGFLAEDVIMAERGAF